MTPEARRARDWVPTFVLAIGAMFAAWRWSPHGWPAPASSAVVVIAGLLLLIELELPWGGAVLLGHTALIALVVLLPPARFAAFGGGAIAIAAPTVLDRRPGPWLVLARLIAASGVAVAVAAAASWVVPAATAPHGEVGTRWVVVAVAIVVGVAYVAVDFVVQIIALPAGGRPDLRSTAAVYMSLIAAAAVWALTTSHQLLVGLVALVPLLVLWTSYRRYWQAQCIREEMAHSLALLAEVAGAAAIGHGERTALYAGALADWLALPRREVEAITTAARLHHLSDVVCGPDDTAARRAETVTSILGGLADFDETTSLLAGLASDSPDGRSLPHALVDVCDAFDRIVESHGGGLEDAAVRLLAAFPEGTHRTAAIALAQLCDRHPAIRREAASLGEHIRQLLPAVV